jgi:hypothetical protein
MSWLIAQIALLALTAHTHTALRLMSLAFRVLEESTSKLLLQPTTKSAIASRAHWMSSMLTP